MECTQYSDSSIVRPLRGLTIPTPQYSGTFIIILFIAALGLGSGLEFGLGLENNVHKQGLKANHFMFCRI